LALDQFNNVSWKGLFDGYMVFCGSDFLADGTITLNETMYEQYCNPLRLAVEAKNAEFHMCLGTVPPAAIANPSVTIESAVQMALKHNWSGYNIDDESHGAPFGTIEEAKVWIQFINTFADGLHKHGLQLTADVQSVTKPWKFQPAAELTMLLSTSTIDRWINMVRKFYPPKHLIKRTPSLTHHSFIRYVPQDTYYFSTGRLLDALDYYSQFAMPSEKCGVGMKNRVDITYDGYQARFHAIETSGVLELDMFIAPISDAFLPYLWKFKTGCKGCTNNGVLSCWSDMKCH